VANVTVTYVEVAADMRSATVHVSVMGANRPGSLCLHGLTSAAGYLHRSGQADPEHRYTPAEIHARRGEAFD